jgi:hypothetical protein
MRLWSLHPKYLDAQGLVALWRETLLAKKVLENRTKGYKYHPQLDRFKTARRPLDAIDSYLEAVYNEAAGRGYKFDKSKFKRTVKPVKITVTSGQIDFEAKHLLRKLKKRNYSQWKETASFGNYEAHPLFTIRQGAVELWEKT